MFDEDHARFIIPRRDPKDIAFEAEYGCFWESGIIPTTIIDSLTIYGVRIMSFHRQADEYQLMADALATMPKLHRYYLQVVEWNNNHFLFTLRPFASNIPNELKFEIAKTFLSAMGSREPQRSSSGIVDKDEESRILRYRYERCDKKQQELVSATAKAD